MRVRLTTIPSESENAMKAPDASRRMLMSGVAGSLLATAIAPAAAQLGGALGSKAPGQTTSTRNAMPHDRVLRDLPRGVVDENVEATQFAHGGVASYATGQVYAAVGGRDGP
jgi:hypothetical protein